MDARQQDPGASARTGGNQAVGAASSNGGAASKSIGVAELLAIAAGLGGLYLLVRIRTEAAAHEHAELAVHEHEPSESHAASVAGWGHTFPHPDNPPAWVHNEPLWDRAKHVVRPHWHEYREPWAVVAHVYEQMGGLRN
jgi:hypothetical protein